MQESVIEVANRVVTISFACNQIGMGIPDAQVLGNRSVKVYCPFPFGHSDGGSSKAMRIYPDTNSAWCFACSEYFSPVGMFSRANDMSALDAANALLLLVNYRIVDTDERWLALVEPADPELDLAALGEALQIYCRRIDAAWDIKQLDGSVADCLGRALTLLPRVKNVADARQWLETAKAVLTRELVAA